MKKALILGVNGTLGSNIYDSLINLKYDVIGTIRKKCEKNNFFQMDISNIESIENLINEIKKKGKIDLFTSTIANKPIINKFEKIKFETFKNDFEINCLNHIYLIQKLIPYINKKGNIIFILSEVTHNEPPKYWSSYTATKYYLLGLMKTLAEELKSNEIRINAISPGMMDTPFIENIPGIVKKIYIRNSKNKKFIDPKDVTKKIIEIVQNEHLNGKNIIIK